jgi:branched-chain amino acid transport system permease protein
MPFLPKRRMPLAVFGLILLLLPFVFTNKYQLSILILVGLAAIVCVGLNLFVGTAGQISLGHAGFFGIGAYASAILTGDFGWNGFAAIAAGIAISSLLAAAVGWPILRLKDHYLAMATLGVGIVIYLLLVHQIGLTGGPDGRPVSSLRFLGERVRGEWTWYWIVAGVLFVCTWAVENISSSPWGRALLAVHGSEYAAASSGIDVHRLKVAAFAVSAGMASLAGSLYAHSFAFVTPDQAGFLHSVEFVVMIVVGGLGSVYGGIVGAAIVVMLPQLLTALKDYEQLAFGLLLIVVVCFMRRGIVPSLAAAIGARR